MNYATIKYNDIANGPGVRTSLFVSGCRHHCKNCFNEIAWDFNYGEKFNQTIIDNILASLKPDYVAGLSILGGEPFEPENQDGLIELLKQTKEKYPEKEVWCYSGFTMEQLTDENSQNYQKNIEMLNYIDVLVDGRFVEERKDLALIFRGSSNQRIIDVKKTLEARNVIWLDGVWERKMGNGNIKE